MVAGSDEFVKLVHERGVYGVEESGVRTKLRWFRDKRGVVRWGIEVADGDVEWVDAPEKDMDDADDEVSLKRFWKSFQRTLVLCYCMSSSALSSCTCLPEFIHLAS
jgi:hypothetical protein